MYQVPIDISPTDLHVDSDNCILHTLLFLPGIESGISAWNVRSWNQLLEPQEEGHLLAEADKEKNWLSDERDGLLDPHFDQSQLPFTFKCLILFYFLGTLIIFRFQIHNIISLSQLVDLDWVFLMFVGHQQTMHFCHLLLQFPGSSIQLELTSEW